MDILDAIPDGLKVYIVGFGATAIVGVIGKMLPRKKIAGTINNVDSFLSELVITISKVVLIPSGLAGAGLSKFLLTKLPKSTAEKIEEGLISTLAEWLKQLLWLVQNFVTALFEIPVNCVNEFIEGLKKDNTK